MEEVMTKPKRPPMVQKLKKRLQDNPKVNLVDMHIPLADGSETPKLKDILEDNVDAKFYLRNEIVEKIIKESDFTERLVSIKVDKGQ